MQPYGQLLDNKMLQQLIKKFHLYSDEMLMVHKGK